MRQGVNPFLLRGLRQSNQILSTAKTTIGKRKMATQYHFLVSCKKTTDTAWTLEMRADGGEIPMSVVQPDSGADGVLTTDPIAQTITEVKAMTHYLRQLNKRNGRGPVGHNDSAIWNISQRLSQLQLGQQITVKISYFEHKGLRSGLYEINSLGVFPPSNLASVSAESLSRAQSAPLPQVVIDTIANLGSRVDTLQRELHTAQQTLHEHGMRLKAQEEQTEHLVDENRQLRESRAAQTTVTQSTCPRSQEAPSSQPPPSSESADEDNIGTEAQSLFQQFIKASTPSTSLNEPSADYPRKGRRKGN